HMHAEGRSPNTIWAYSSCLHRVFEGRGLTVDMGHPNIRKLPSATRREGRPPKGKDPLRTEHVVAMLRATEDTPAGLQGRALLLLTWKICRLLPRGRRYTFARARPIRKDTVVGWTLRMPSGRIAVLFVP
ncbi:MAG: hypothetical protein OXF02_05680, partial [Simkaniaceae bacterium]|nr:hypothetical protein [Simkaniaceae bacterium]